MMVNNVGNRKIWLLILLCLAGVSLAATPTPSPEYIQLFKNLSPQQKQKLLHMLQQQSDDPASSNNKTTTPKLIIERSHGKQPNGIINRDFAEKNSKMDASASEKIKDDSVIEDVPQQQTDATKLKLESAQTKDQKLDSNKQKLQQFGYGLFAGQPTTFAPATDIPIPANFITGPGDTIKLLLYGRENHEYELQINRDGSIHFPGVGPVTVAGMQFQDMRDMLLTRVKNQYIGVSASVAMGALRSIRVFVLGDAFKPGSYTVSALSTMTNALFVSGGVLPIGSLRRIKLKRQGQMVTTLDLYDLLLRGDTSKDKRLQPGDVIFIPPIGKTVGIGGEVRRPAVYELRNEKTVGQIVKLAGGLLPTAFANGSQLERLRHGKERTLIDINLAKPLGNNERIQNGDVIRVYSILDKMEDIVLLSGYAQRIGGYQWQKDMHLTDLIPSAKYLLSKADVGYVIIKREVYPSRHITILSADLEAAWRSKGGEFDVALMPRDEIVVFTIDEDRSQSIAPIVELLKQQARYGKPEPIVSIDGNVRFTGEYPYEDGMDLSKLIRAAVDVLPDTDMQYSLIVRENQLGTRIESFSVRLEDVLSKNDNVAVVHLQPRDRVYIFNKQDSRQDYIEGIIERLKNQAGISESAKVVTIRGHVRSPGSYPLESNMRINDLIRAAGDMTEAAYTLDAELTRYQIIDGQHRQVKHLPINLKEVLNSNQDADILLNSHDSLTVKLLPAWDEIQSIEIKGEVQFPGKYPIQRGETLSHVMNRAGGLTEWAYPQGAIFRRKNLMLREQAELDKLATNLEAEIAAVSMQEQDSSQETKEAIGISKSLLSQAKDTQAVGRLVINLETIIDEDGGQDIVLKDGDELYIPGKTQEVTVLGEVFSPTSHIFTGGLSKNKYINLSGGLTHKADKDKIYVVRANGAVVAGGKVRWYKFNKKTKIQPGDTIVVPLDADKVKPLRLWTDITKIMYQVGIAAASWKTIGVF